MLLWNVIEETVKNLLYSPAADFYHTLCLLTKTNLQTMSFCASELLFVLFEFSFKI